MVTPQTVSGIRDVPKAASREPAVGGSSGSVSVSTPPQPAQFAEGLHEAKRIDEGPGAAELPIPSGLI